MPLLRFVVGIREYYHADDALDVVGDAGAGNHPPPQDTDSSNGECGELLVFLRSKDIREVVLA